MTEKVCVAAIDLQTLTIVRPLQSNGGNWSPELIPLGLQPGRILCQRVLQKSSAGGLPHGTEDIQLAAQFKMHSLLSNTELYDYLVPFADASISALFGGQVKDAKYVIDGSLCRSLGSVLVDPSQVDLYLKGSTRLRLTFTDQSCVRYDLPVNEYSYSVNILQALQKATKRIYKAEAACTRLLLRIGLARGFAGTEKKWDPKRCYLQVNGILFAGPDD